jgi:hypothetical protein
MLARHAWHSNISDTLLLAYLAKRRSETAPGVGKETDMAIIGPGLGEFLFVNDAVMDRLGQEYDKLIEGENVVFASAKTEIAQFVQQITSQTTNLAVTEQAGSMPKDEPSA